MTESERARTAIQESMPEIKTGVVIRSADFENWYVDMLLDGHVTKSYRFNSKSDGEEMMRVVLNVPSNNLHRLITRLERELSDVKDKLYRIEQGHKYAVEIADEVF